jgi:hypothetical protein
MTRWPLVVVLASSACGRAESRLLAEPAGRTVACGPVGPDAREPVAVATPEGDPPRLGEDAGAVSRIVIRFAVRSRRLPPPTSCTDLTLNLEIPSRGWTHVLCSSGCGPYRFENHKDSPSLATFSCDGDLEDVDGTVSVRDSVVLLEMKAVGGRAAQIPIPGVPPALEGDSKPLRPPEHVTLPLRCGSSVMLETSPVAKSPDDKSL